MGGNLYYSTCVEYDNDRIESKYYHEHYAFSCGYLNINF